MKPTNPHKRNDRFGLWLPLFHLMIFQSIVYGQISNLQFNPVNLPREIPNIDCIYEDSRGLIWIGSYSGLFLYDGYRLESFTNEPKDSNSLGDNKINCLLDTGDGNLWIGTQTGLHYFDVQKRKFTSYANELNGVGTSVYNLVEASSGLIWAVTAEGVFNIQKDVYGAAEIKMVFKKSRLGFSTLDIQDNLLVSDGRQLFLKRKDSRDFLDLEVFKNPGFHGESITFLISDQDGRVWINTELGIHQYLWDKDSTSLFFAWPVKGILNANTYMTEMARNQFIVASNDFFYELDLHEKALKKIPLVISTNSPDEKVRIYASEILRSGNEIIWLSYNGFNLHLGNLRRNYFKIFKSDISKKFTGPGSYFELYDFYPGQLLIPHPKGHRLFDYHKGEFTDFPLQPHYDQKRWKGWLTCFDENVSGRLWIGTETGIFLYDKNQSRFVDLRSEIEDFAALDHVLVRDILEDSRKNVWIASWNEELFRIDQDRKKLIRYDKILSDKSLGHSQLGFRVIYEDQDQKIWIGSRNGLLRYFERSDSFTIYQHKDDDPESMSENTSFCIYQDTLGYIWSGSYGGGLNRLDTATGKFRHFSVRDGLLDNNIFSLIPDNQGHLWLVSYNGITRFNPYTYEMIHVTSHNGLGSDHYEAFTFGKSKNSGEILLLGNGSLDIFHPDSFRLSDFRPPIFFTDFQLFNESVPIRISTNDDPSIFYLKEHISWTKEIRLPYDQNVFTIDYAALDYSGPMNIQYAYQMEGFDPGWQMAQQKRSATYTNLDPGQYLFKVRATNADGVWSNEYNSMAFIITPPWWASAWAYSLYALFAGLLLYVGYYFQKRRWFLQTALQLREQEAERLKELDALKTNLYTNITHEFRTPLTVISGMVSLIRNRPSEWLAKGTDLIEQQSTKLLDMVNQMLDLHKIEAGKMELHLIQADVISYINYLVEPFQFAAKTKNVDLRLEHQRDELILDFDPDKLGQIISNLLTNAIKYTKEGNIILKTQLIHSDVFEVMVQDTGIGIPAEKIGFIFDRFYQTEQGTTRRGEGAGIGLSLAKELIKLMGGVIEVQSKLQKGSLFTIRWRTSNNAVLNQSMVFPTKAATNAVVSVPISSGFLRKEGERILIIEDNPDVRTYLRALLQERYQVVEAVDGNDGIDQSIKLVPDLIICDVMMPGKDGYAVCDALHQHMLTSHIPIILLTAKANATAKIEGYQRGADAYLTKPFHPDELTAQIGMLLEQRKRLQDLYCQQWPKGFSDEHTLRSDPFIHELQKLILNELSNEALDISQICKSMFVSRSQLHHKVKAITGYSTSIYVRKIRLQEARRLIAETTLPIAEIAYQTGFKDPNFFSRVFKQEFGVSPKEGR